MDRLILILCRYITIIQTKNTVFKYYQVFLIHFCKKVVINDVSTLNFSNISEMKALIVFFCFFAFYGAIEAINCQQAAVGCNQNCPQNKQLLVQVSPAAYYAAACNLLASSPNNCCLMSMTYSSGLNSYFENWCCQTTGPTTVKNNIAGTSYIVSATVGEKRSLENEGGKLISGNFFCYTHFIFFLFSVVTFHTKL